MQTTHEWRERTNSTIDICNKFVIYLLNYLLLLDTSYSKIDLWSGEFILQLRKSCEVDIEKTGQRIKVLLIEDNPDDQILTKRMLDKSTHSSFDITFAGGLSAGISSIVDGTTDAILLDLDLPDSSGVETFLKLKLQAPEIPTVVLSGFGDEEDALKAVREGAQDYLLKGQIDSNLLTRSLRYAIERKRAEEIIKKLAYHDSLTGLPSRMLFNDRFLTAMAERKRNNKKIALLMVDLDHFKDINDNFGHDAGDELLKQISARMMNTLRQTDTICRMGGDEFVLLISDVSENEMIDEVVQRVLLAIGKQFILRGTELKISASLGVAIYPADGETLEILIKHADIAMYETKKMGRNNYLYYHPGMNTEIKVPKAQKL